MVKSVVIYCQIWYVLQSYMLFYYVRSLLLYRHVCQIFCVLLSDLLCYTIRFVVLSCQICYIILSDLLSYTVRSVVLYFQICCLIMLSYTGIDSWEVQSQEALGLLPNHLVRRYTALWHYSIKYSSLQSILPHSYIYTFTTGTFLILHRLEVWAVYYR